MRPLLAAALLLSACAHRADAVSYVTVASEAEGRDMRYGVYTPPGWTGETALPLVVFLHGGGDDETVMSKHPVVPRRLDEAIEAGWLPPFVMVTPVGEKGFWRNWADGSHRYADWVMQDVIGDARARYNVSQTAEGTHLMGISMGGAGTMYLGLQHLDAFDSMTVFSAPLFDAQEVEDFLSGKFIRRWAPFDRIFGGPGEVDHATDNAYNVLQSEADLRGTHLLIGAGTVDIRGILPSTRRMHAHLEAQDVPHDTIIYKGGHRWVDWSRVFPVAMCLRLAGEACARPDSGFYALDAAAREPAWAGTAPEETAVAMPEVTADTAP